MTDYIYNIQSAAVLGRLAKAMGFTRLAQDGKESIVADSFLETKLGGYSLNHVGVVYQPTGKMIVHPLADEKVPEMAPVPGEWGRLRINGASAFIDRLKKLLETNPEDITIYSYVPGDDKKEVAGFWSSDGKTPAPEWVENVGQFL